MYILFGKNKFETAKIMYKKIRNANLIQSTFLFVYANRFYIRFGSLFFEHVISHPKLH